MNGTENWYEKARSIITSPDKFFDVQEPTGYGEPLKFAAISLLITGVISAIGAFVFAPPAVGAVTSAITALIASVIGGLIGIFIGAGIIHIFVYLLGGRKGYQSTFTVAAYVTVLSPISALLGLIPIIGGLLGLVVSLYGLYIYIKGIEIYHGMTTGRAAIAVILPALIFVIIAIILSILFFSLAFLSNLATAP